MRQHPVIRPGPGRTNVQRHAAFKRRGGESDDRTIAPESQAVQRQIRQIAQYFDLFQGDTQPGQHFEFIGGHILRRQSGKSEILAIESGHRERIAVLVLCARQEPGEFGGAMSELAETNARVAQLVLMVGIHGPEPVFCNPAIQLYEVIHSVNESDFRH